MISHNTAGKRKKLFHIFLHYHVTYTIRIKIQIKILYCSDISNCTDCNILDYGGTKRWQAIPHRCWNTGYFFRISWRNPPKRKKNFLSSESRFSARLIIRNRINPRTLNSTRCTVVCVEQMHMYWCSLGRTYFYGYSVRGFILMWERVP